MNREQNVAEALELLIEEIEKVEDELREECAHAVRTRQDSEAEKLRAIIDGVTKFRKRVEPLRAEWLQIVRGRDRKLRPRKRNLGGPRAPRGARTPESEFREPILKALVRLGGTASVKDVLATVEEMMRSRLRPIDYEPLPSSPKTSRWYNTAQWCRNKLVKEGLLAKNSRHGVWEITEKGRRYLAGR